MADEAKTQQEKGDWAFQIHTIGFWKKDKTVNGTEDV